MLSPAASASHWRDRRRRASSSRTVVAISSLERLSRSPCIGAIHIIIVRCFLTFPHKCSQERTNPYAPARWRMNIAALYRGGKGAAGPKARQQDGELPCSASHHRYRALPFWPPLSSWACTCPDRKSTRLNSSH